MNGCVLRYIMKRTFALLIITCLIITMLSACGGSGRIILDGRYVLSDSGRSYVVYEPETDIPHFVKIEAREDSDITFDKLHTGDLIRAYISVFKDFDVAGKQITLLHTEVSYCEKRRSGTEDDIPTDIMNEIEVADMIWNDLENNKK